MAKAKGVSLNIGLNAVDPDHYVGWPGTLIVCEADATDMGTIAAARGFSVRTLLTKDATRGAVQAALRAAADSLVGGDIFVLYYSGHGAQVPDRNGDEEDQKDETWCLYDGMLIDDEIYDSLANFKPAVRILVLSDSCHSGSVIKAAFYNGVNVATANEATPPIVYKAMPIDFEEETYSKNKTFYDSLQTGKNMKRVDDVTADVLLISACKDNQLAAGDTFNADGTINSLFTSTLKRVWDSGRFRGHYQHFYEMILDQMPPTQSPEYYWLNSRNREFERQKPFKV